MITMNELVDLRMQQHLAHEIYRQQIMQRIPDPFPPILPIAMPRHVIMPPRVTLPGVEMTLQNDDLWKQFHQIGTEMIITKSGRRMFPSMRLSVAGLDEETNYCVLLEMVPIGDCRYKFSGSQWVPAGGAEPQSPQRMYLHPDSPATGAHWQAQPILFNKVKLTNNTLDNSGHIVLASMHKYQPRLHVIRTADLAQIPWAPQQAFVFTETEFVAVTAYQNDRITKLKIDNNPFAKGFRETGQSRCKRKMSSSPTDEDQDQTQSQSQTGIGMGIGMGMGMGIGMGMGMGTGSGSGSLDMSPTKSSEQTANSDLDGPQIKRLRSNGSASSLSSSLDGNGQETGASSSSLGLSSPPPPPPPPPSSSSSSSSTTTASLPPILGHRNSSVFMQHFQQNMQSLLRPSLVDLACTYLGRSPHHHHQHHHRHQQQEYNGNVPLQSPLYPSASILQAALPSLPALHTLPQSHISGEAILQQQQHQASSDESVTDELELDVGSEATEDTRTATTPTPMPALPQSSAGDLPPEPPSTKRKGFSISAILGGSS
ncbi:T-box transcription factor TBX20 [Drosophila willistoni]|uniref:T-box transcription factor TBX20 n=1 Tax=Drosophila willistoni TaxID=7260 RepID=UPI00017D83CE|nr:T-box transcription factor TBX20 [Drosophila willistoni]